MSELNYQVLDMNGQEIGSLELNPDIFGAQIHQESVHLVVRQQLAAKRAGTHSVLGRSDMKGGGKKPFKQKGTGHARQGSGISPLNPGGAILFGPSPRDYSFKVPKAVRRKALLSVLSDKVRQGTLRVVDNLVITSGKTKDMQKFLKTIDVEGKALLVVGADESGVEEIKRSSRNLPNVNLLPPEGLNVYDVLNAKFLIGTKAALAAVEKRLAL